MRIALCLEYPIGQFGGTEVLVTELIKGLSVRHEIVLVSPDTESSLAKSSAAPFMKTHVPFASGKFYAQTARELAGKIATVKPDVAHFHFGGNYGWGNRAFWNCPIFYLDEKIPRLSTNHGAFSILEGYCWEKRPLAVKLALLPPAWLSKQIILARLHCEVAVSQHDFHALRRWYSPMHGKFRWIYHSRIHADSVPKNVPTNERRKVVLCVGTIGTRKGQPVLVEAFSRIAKKFPEWRLILIGRSGEDEMLRQIQETIAQRNLESQIQWLGERSDAEVEDWLKHAAIFAMPSTYEGLGLSLQEAQFHGCACIGTRCGGVEDLIRDGDNGLLVDVNNSVQLASALEKLISDSSLREKFSHRAPQSVLEKEMTAAKMIWKYEMLYTKIVAGK